MNAQSFPVLNTERLRLRAFTPADAMDVQRLAGDKLIADTTFLIPHPYPDGLAEEWISTHQKLFNNGTDYIFAIVSKENEELIGAIGLTVEKNFNIGEIGYWIGVPFWNKGYCTEAVRVILRYGFKELKLNKIHAHHFITNSSSGRVLIKSGMQFEGLLKQHIIKDGKYTDIKTYGILKEEYESVSSSINEDDSVKVEQLDHVELFVPDRFEAAEWYGKNLGIKILEGYQFWSENPNGPLMISPDGGNTKIALFTGQPQADKDTAGFYRAAFRINGSTFLSFIKRCEYDLELYDHHGKRLTKDSIVDHNKSFSIYFNDPYGNHLELTTYEHEYMRRKLN